MSTELTKNDLCDPLVGPKHLFALGYCEFQAALQSCCGAPSGYNSGLYGWNWDYFTYFDDDGNKIGFCTGYRNLVGIPIAVSDHADLVARDTALRDVRDRQEREVEARAILDELVRRYVGG